MWLKICKFWTWVVFKLQIIRWWAHAYRYFKERQYILPISSYKDMGSLVKFIGTLIWTKDTWRQLWDVVSKPEKVEYIGKIGSRHVGDCDEFAIYISNAILVSQKEGFLLDYKDPKFLTVIWMKDIKMAGHNVCLMKKDGKVGYIDYGWPLWYNTMDELIVDLIKRYAGDASLVCYMISDPVTLKPEVVKI